MFLIALQLDIRCGSGGEGPTRKDSCAYVFFFACHFRNKFSFEKILNFFKQLSETKQDIPMGFEILNGNSERNILTE